MTGSAWAEKFGRIPKSTGAESGLITLYGYQRELMDAMCDPSLSRVTVMKAARVGYTRLFTLAVGYHLHHDPTLCAIAQPVKEDAEDFGGTEIAPMLRETPVLRRMIRPSASRRKAGQGDVLQAVERLQRCASSARRPMTRSDATRRGSSRPTRSTATGWTPGTTRARATSSTCSGSAG